VEAELNLVTAEETELSPVGLGRKEPEPLPEPKYVRSIMLVVTLVKTVYFAELCVILYPVSDYSRNVYFTCLPTSISD